MKKKSKDGLASKVMVFPKKPVIDDTGRYIPYCDFGCHRGLILREEVCQIRECRHYHKLYLEYKGKE